MQGCRIDLIDGLQNIMPYGTTTLLQTTLSNLLNAYKRNEIEATTGLGIFALSATLTDRAEPSESLMASVAWQVGLDPVQHLLCSDQLDAFRRGLPIIAEDDIRGRAGAYLVNAELTLAQAETRHWHIVADVNQDSRDVVELVRTLGADGTQVQRQLEEDIAQGTDELVKYVASADGLQLSADESVTAHHFANVLFNIMRGGIFADGYRVDKRDFLDFVDDTQSDDSIQTRSLVRSAAGHRSISAISMPRPQTQAWLTWNAFATNICPSCSAGATAIPADHGISSPSTSGSLTERRAWTTRATGVTSFRIGSRWP